MHNLTYKRMYLEDDTDIPELITIYETPEIAQYISIGDNYFRYITNSEEVYFYKVYENNKLIGKPTLKDKGACCLWPYWYFPNFKGWELVHKL